MGAKYSWRGFLGVIFVGSTFTGLAPVGPWNDSTFTSGALGLFGLALIYLEWFRITFGEGLVPTIDRWSNPRQTSKYVMLGGAAVLLAAYILGRTPFAPEPTGLVLSVIGLLIFTNGFYVWMVSAGPLGVDEEE